MNKGRGMLLPALLALLLLLGGCAQAGRSAPAAPEEQEAQYPGLEATFALAFGQPDQELQELWTSPDNYTVIDGGKVIQSGWDSRYHQELRDRLGAYYTQDAYDAVVSSVTRYQRIVADTGRTAQVEQVSYETAPDRPGRVGFVIDARPDPAEGQGEPQTVQVKGYAYLDEEGKIDTFQMGGTLYHEMEKEP